MNRVFVDTSFITALVNEQDEHHARAVELADLFDACPLVTTDATAWCGGIITEPGAVATDHTLNLSGSIRSLPLPVL